MRSALALFLLVLALGCGKQKPLADSRADSKAPAGSKAASAPSAAEEAAGLQGAWQVIAIEAAGDKVPDDRVKKIDLSYLFEGNKVTVHRPDRKDNPGTFAVDPKHTPKRIDLYLPGQGRMQGVYSVDGKTLRLCLSVDERKYPTAVESKAEPKTDLLTFQKK